MAYPDDAPPASAVLAQSRSRLRPGDYNPAVANAAANLEDYKRGFTSTPAGRAAMGDPQAYQAALNADAGYQKALAAHQNAQAAHVQGYTQPGYDVMAAAARGAANQANAIETDAGSRRITAQGQAAEATGHGKAYEGEGTLSTAQAGNVTAMTPYQQAAIAAETDRKKTLTPVEARQGYAQAGDLESQTAARGALLPGQVAAQQFQVQQGQALLPGQVAGQSAGNRKTAAEAGSIETDTRLMPEKLKAAQALAAQDRELKTRQADAEISSKTTVVDPISGQLIDRTTGQPVAGGAGGGTPAAPADTRGLFGKAADALRGASGAVGDVPFSWNPARPIAMAAAGMRGASEGWSGATPAAPAAAPAGAGGAAGAVPNAVKFLSDAGQAGVGRPPTGINAAPERRRLPDGRIIEKVGTQFYQILPDGRKVALPAGAG